MSTAFRFILLPETINRSAESGKLTCNLFLRHARVLKGKFIVERLAYKECLAYKATALHRHEFGIFRLESITQLLEFFFSANKHSRFVLTVLVKHFLLNLEKKSTI